jgi:hypothetical protein
MLVLNQYKCIALILGMLVATIQVSAQEEDKPRTFRRPTTSYSQDTVSPDLKNGSFTRKKKFDIDKLLIEPNIQFYLDRGGIQFGLLPSVGYEVYKNLYVGGSLTYNLNYFYGDVKTGRPSQSTQYYGGGPFIHYKVWRGVFARVRAEMVALRYPTSYSNNTVKYDTRGVPYLWLGAGYNLTNSRNFFVPVALYFNPLFYLTNNTYSIQQSALYLQLTFYIYGIKI